MLKNLRAFVQLIFCVVYSIAIVAMDDARDIKRSAINQFQHFEQLATDIQKIVVCYCIANTDSLNDVMKTIENLSRTCKKFHRYMQEQRIENHITDSIHPHLSNIHKNKKINISKPDIQSHYRLLDTALEYDLLLWIKPRLNLDRDINVNYPALYKLEHVKEGYFKTESTLLHQAANYNAYKITKFLLANFPVDLELEDLGTYTPLQMACMSKSFEVAELLLQQGANPRPNNKHYNLTTNILNHLNNNSLTIKEKEKAQRLLELKQKINHSYLDGMDMIILKLDLLKDYINQPSLFPLYFFSVYALLFARVVYDKLKTRIRHGKIF